MNWILVVLVVLIVIAIVVAKFAPQGEGQKSEFEYRKVGPLFTAAERSFLGVLKLAVNEEFEVFGKVRVADVITPKKGQQRSDWQRSFNKISAKHFDFLLCKKDNLTPICAIELNDKSHNSKQRKTRDDFLRSACGTAHLTLIEISAQATYQLENVREQLSEILPTSVPILIPSQEPAEEGVGKTEEKICPKCSSKLVLKTSKAGKSAGSKFWACPDFPKCRFIEAKMPTIDV